MNRLSSEYGALKTVKARFCLDFQIQILTTLYVVLASLETGEQEA